MTSKSELKRHAVQDPGRLADYVRRLEERCEAWKALAQGRGLLLVAHQNGQKPSARAHELIAQGRKVLGTEDAP